MPCDPPVSPAHSLQSLVPDVAQATGLHLNQHHEDFAVRLFTLAVQHNFVQGRKTENVCSACLYIVCRREKTPHLLIDFSDLLQTNVFPLGQTFLKLVRAPAAVRGFLWGLGAISYP